jgi:hypothetical protein
LVKIGSIAQLVEQLTHIQFVVGSIPTTATARSSIGRTAGFQSEKRGSIPLRATEKRENIMNKEIDEKVLISVEEYENLKRDSAILAALEAGGVDNWEWYSESLRDFFNKEE